MTGLPLTLASQFLLLEDLLPHLPIAEHGKENGSAEHVSGEGREKKPYGCIVERNEPGHPAVERLGGPGDDMGELKQGDKIGQSPITRNSPLETEAMIQTTAAMSQPAPMPLANISHGELRIRSSTSFAISPVTWAPSIGRSAKAQANKKHPATFAASTIPQSRNILRSQLEIPARDDRENSRQHVFREELLPPENDDDEANRVAERSNHMVPLRLRQTGGQGGLAEKGKAD